MHHEFTFDKIVVLIVHSFSDNVMYYNKRILS